MGVECVTCKAACRLIEVAEQKLAWLEHCALLQVCTSAFQFLRIVACQHVCTYAILRNFIIAEMPYFLNTLWKALARGCVVYFLPWRIPL